MTPKPTERNKISWKLYWFSEI